MRGRIVLWVSLALNALLLLAFWRFRASPEGPTVSELPPPTPIPQAVRTNVVVRRLNFVWSQIESDDYGRFIANLRNIACPESTIRDIIVADINQLFAKRRSTEIHTPAQDWWRSDPDPVVAQQAATAIRALETERQSLLTRLLGPDWESTNYPYPAPSDAPALDGPYLGTLTPAARAAVQQEQRSATAREQAYLAAVQAAGDTPDPVELARLKRQTQESLSRWLTPQQLEEYLLRYSTNAAELRTALRGMTVTPDEFRALFHTYENLDRDLAANSPNVGGASSRSPETLERLRENALREQLGADRYDDLKLQQDPLYQQALGTLQQAGVSQDHLVPLAAILRLTQEEEDRIRTNTVYSASERLERLNQARQAQLDSLQQLFGEEAYERYLEKHPDLWEKPSP